MMMSKPLNGLGIDLLPTRTVVPFHALLTAVVEAELHPARCRVILEQAFRADPALERYFDLAELDAGGPVATAALLFDYPPAPAWSWAIHQRGPGTRKLTISPSSVEGVAEIVRAHRGAADREEFLAGLADLDEVLRDDLRRGAEPVRTFGSWPAPRRAGIYRREHASVALHSGTSCLLTDPMSLSFQWTTNGGASPAEAEDWSPDAILVTHTHDDHWHLPSVLWHANRDAPVVVPRIPRANLLASQDLAASLQLADQTCIAPSWDAVLRFGDFEVDVLPFFGEQPSVATAWLSPELRNWGSCYRVTCPAFSVVVLADSGVDPDGSMVEVLAESLAKRGPATAILATSGAFAEIFNWGLPHYIWTFPFSFLQSAFADYRDARLGSTTLGVEGIAEACDAVQARHYLPYANGFTGLGRDPVSPESGQHPEGAMLSELRELLATRGSRTEIVDWRPGDSVHLDGGELSITRCRPADDPGGDS
jgi:hypothetical protein